MMIMMKMMIMMMAMIMVKVMISYILLQKLLISTTKQISMSETWSWRFTQKMYRGS